MLKYFTNDQTICYQVRNLPSQLIISISSIFLAMEAVQGHNRYCLLLSCSYYNIRDTRVLEMKQNYSVLDYFNPSLKYIDNNLALGTVLCISVRPRPHGLETRLIFPMKSSQTLGRNFGDY